MQDSFDEKPKLLELKKFKGAKGITKFKADIEYNSLELDSNEKFEDDIKIENF